MTANRQFPTAGSGSIYMAKIAEEGTALYNAAALPLTNVAGGTAANPKTTCKPSLSAGLLDGMSFWWTAVSDSPAGGMTMVIDGKPAVAMVNDAGQPIGLSVIKAGLVYKLLVWNSVIIVTNTATIVKVNDFQLFTSSGTWLKPTGCPANALVTVFNWAAGGGGGSGTGGAVSGGGGGCCLIWTCKAGDLPASVAVTIPAGGAVGVAGGTSSFGSFVISYGGGAGASNSGAINQVASGGAGGGAFQAGGNGTAANSNSTASTSRPATLGGDPSAGGGNSPSINTTNNGSINGSSTWASSGTSGGGGAGGSHANGGASSVADPGGRALWGGGGGGARTSSGGGVSVFGGNGGAQGSAGQAPGGGGGSNAAGARGEVRVYVNG